MTEKFMTREECLHHNEWILQDQFNVLLIGILLGQDNRDLDIDMFYGLTEGEHSISNYINTKYNMNAKRGDVTSQLLEELAEKIQARMMPSLPTE